MAAAVISDSAAIAAAGVNLVDRFNPTSVPFATNIDRFRPSFISDSTITITYVGDYYGKLPGGAVEYDGSPALNHTEDDLVTTCPEGQVVLQVKFASVGVPSGLSGRCPASYFKRSGKLRPLPLPEHVCRSITPYNSLEVLYDTSTVRGCHATESYAITAKRCIGFRQCTHLPNTSNYGMSCPDHLLTDKSMVFSLGCGECARNLHVPELLFLRQTHSH